MPQLAGGTGPGAGFLSGAVHSGQDSIRVASPLPGGLSALFRFAFNLPQWIQITAVVTGALVALAVLAFLWMRRGPIIAWVRTRPGPVVTALAVVAFLGVVGFAGGSAYMWHYTQHDNGFCTGCHIMNPAYSRFTKSEHAQLQCHNCHQQPITASMFQLVVWVAERPDKIPPHAKVPNNVCAGCHITGQPKVWQRIASTAGHRVHLESDSSALRGVQCVTCHGVEVHHFAPVSKTCGQAGCHETIGITLGKMQSQTSLHCVSCHQFTAEVPALATRDSAAGTLVPGERQCLACHQMQVRAARFDATKDPHNGTCGKCHNPHTQRVAADAAKTCAGCHIDWRKSPFHTGVRHRNVATNCTLCHEPHQARVDASDCAGCHKAVAGRKAGSRTLAPPLPFDTTRALQLSPAARSSPSPEGRGDRGEVPHGPNVFLDLLPASFPLPADTFPHDRHAKISCITCHASDREHGKLTFEAPRGCQICHHQRPSAVGGQPSGMPGDCTTCHTDRELATPLPETVRITVTPAPPRERRVQFSHAAHRSSKCTECHTTPVTMAPMHEVKACTSCHASHHAAGRACSTCHSGEQLQVAHRPAMTTHDGCDACHRTETVSLLVPTRSLCVTCHDKQRDHYATAECTTCHFQAAPEEYRRHLLKRTTPA